MSRWMAPTSSTKTPTTVAGNVSSANRCLLNFTRGLKLPAQVVRQHTKYCLENSRFLKIPKLTSMLWCLIYYFA